MTSWTTDGDTAPKDSPIRALGMKLLPLQLVQMGIEQNWGGGWVMFLIC